MKNVKTRKLSTRVKRFLLSGGLLTAVLFLSGCMRFDQETGAPEGALSEIIYNFLIVPLSQFLDILADLAGNYGVAIILFTVLFRLLLLPFTLKQQKGMMEQQVKMQGVQPVTQEIQAEIKATDDPAEQQALNAELMALYRENNISIGGQVAGCLPLLLQMPIFVAMLQVLRGSEAITQATFLGMSLGERSIQLALATGLIYFIQSRMMIKSMPEEQQKTAGVTMYITPIMMMMIGFSSPAGVSLYWMISGFFSLFQQAFNNFYYKPKIEAEVKEKLGDVKTIKRKKKTAPTATKKVNGSNKATPKAKNQQAIERNRKRNSGKQQRNRKN